MRAEFKLWDGNKDKHDGQPVITIRDKPLQVIKKAVRLLERDFQESSLRAKLADSNVKKNFAKFQKELEHDLKKVFEKWDLAQQSRPERVEQ